MMDTLEQGSSGEFVARNRRTETAGIIAMAEMFGVMNTLDHRGPRRETGTPKKHSSPKAKRLRKIAKKSRAINRRIA